MKRPYYICSSGRLKRRQNTIYFESFPVNEPDPATVDEELLAGFTEDVEANDAAPIGKRKPIPVEDIEAFYVLGEMDFNSKFFNFLAQNKIPLHLFNYYGYYSGSYIPREYLPSGFTIVEQVRAYLDTHRRLVIAREIIDAASFNILKNLQYYSNPSRQDEAKSFLQRGSNLEEVRPNGRILQAIQEIEALRVKIKETDTTQELMGLEGNIRERYYRCWVEILGQEYALDKRVKHPPDNAINALVSFSNSLVYTTVLSEIYHTHLNPTISFLHGPGERRYSLALDLAEIFKPILADKMIFKLLNNKQIQEKHFRKELNFCYLEESGRKIVLQEYDERLKTTIKHRSLGRNVSYRHMIRLEAYKLVRHITSKDEYKAFRAWW
ncbi:MAG: type I-B CRISPR-associated endonuclease Cas1b [Bacteroidetes bacterium]|nr:type I-B CRISPR-associated endonuclease Cas1b [Bacteroidota bacterium]MBU1423664.1 type I-B CRISPR-associated endonuclease Cas1b [Bacteroidota bacterium]MBU2447586.1 type I-B CRISPR-associated endonuclease Cas1b [Bacteroidota bacterium]MBU2472341.1 type I-B CRISPR-associated endonuclease Cas1b [Bacteroidota bacterium]